MLIFSTVHGDVLAKRETWCENPMQRIMAQSNRSWKITKVMPIGSWGSREHLTILKSEQLYVMFLQEKGSTMFSIEQS
jgi:hypothetical protein